jgi:hypothetical protein
MSIDNTEGWRAAPAISDRQPAMSYQAWNEGAIQELTSDG